MGCIKIAGSRYLGNVSIIIVKYVALKDDVIVARKIAF